MFQNNHVIHVISEFRRCNIVNSVSVRKRNKSSDQNFITCVFCQNQEILSLVQWFSMFGFLVGRLTLRTVILRENWRTPKVMDSARSIRLVPSRRSFVLSLEFELLSENPYIPAFASNSVTATGRSFQMSSRQSNRRTVQSEGVGGLGEYVQSCIKDSLVYCNFDSCRTLSLILTSEIWCLQKNSLGELSSLN